MNCSCGCGKIIDENKLWSKGHNRKGSKMTKFSIAKRLTTLIKNGNNKAWNKGMTGEEYLRHFKNNKVWNDGLTKDDPRVKNNIDKALKTRLKNNSYPRGKNHPFYGLTKHNSQLFKNHSDRMKKNNPNKNGILWTKDEFRNKVKKSMNLHPNKPETIIINLINELKLPFKYTGDYAFWVDRFCPDFISNDGSKKIIEVNGDYWHNMDEHKERDKRKLETYLKFGYKTLVIWESELKNIKKVKYRLLSF